MRRNRGSNGRGGGGQRGRMGGQQGEVQGRGPWVVKRCLDAAFLLNCLALRTTSSRRRYRELVGVGVGPNLTVVSTSTNRCGLSLPWQRPLLPRDAASARMSGRHGLRV
nr:hypothetical protein CFP56_29967 [Quercus suber]